jgi:hypothetical protein
VPQFARDTVNQPSGNGSSMNDKNTAQPAASSGMLKNPE